MSKPVGGDQSSRKTNHVQQGSTQVSRSKKKVNTKESQITQRTLFGLLNNETRGSGRGNGREEGNFEFSYTVEDEPGEEGSGVEVSENEGSNSEGEGALRPSKKASERKKTATVYERSRTEKRELKAQKYAGLFSSTSVSTHPSRSRYSEEQPLKSKDAEAPKEKKEKTFTEEDLLGFKITTEDDIKKKWEAAGEKFLALLGEGEKGMKVFVPLFNLLFTKSFAKQICKHPNEILQKPWVQLLEQIVACSELSNSKQIVKEIKKYVADENEDAEDRKEIEEATDTPATALVLFLANMYKRFQDPKGDDDLAMEEYKLNLLKTLSRMLFSEDKNGAAKWATDEASIVQAVWNCVPQLFKCFEVFQKFEVLSKKQEKARSESSGSDKKSDKKELEKLIRNEVFPLFFTKKFLKENDFRKDEVRSEKLQPLFVDMAQLLMDSESETADSESDKNVDGEKKEGSETEIPVEAPPADSGELVEERQEEDDVINDPELPRPADAEKGKKSSSKKTSTKTSDRRRKVKKKKKEMISSSESSSSESSGSERKPKKKKSSRKRK